MISPARAFFQAEPPKKPNNWRQKHDDFIASIRASKVAFQAVKEGKELPPPPPPTYDPGNARLRMRRKQNSPCCIVFIDVQPLESTSEMTTAQDLAVRVQAAALGNFF